MSKLTLKNMIFYGHHGVSPAEKEIGQRIEVDVELVSDFEKAGQTDNFQQAVNYVDVYQIVQEIVEKTRFNLIEGIAVAIINRITSTYHLEKIVVLVRKPSPR